VLGAAQAELPRDRKSRRDKGGAPPAGEPREARPPGGGKRRHRPRR